MPAKPPHIAILGGGPGGVSTALTLLDQGLQVTLIEKSGYDDFRSGEHLPPAAKPNLTHLAILEALGREPHRTCPGVTVQWGGETPYENDYLFSPYGDGISVSRPALDIALAATAERRGARLVTGAQPVGLTEDADGWHFRTDLQGGPSTIRADFLVDATGRSAWLAKAVGRKIETYDALVGLVGVSEPCADAAPASMESRLLLEACPDGWWYATALRSGTIVAAYMTDMDLIREDGRSAIDIWRDRFSRSEFVAGRLNDIGIPAAVHVRSTRTQRLPFATGKNWLAVGDAAAGYDPICSEGISKAINDGLCAGKAIAAHFAGDSHALSQYDEQVQGAFDSYLEAREKYYAMEQRWPASPFWRRRQQEPATV